MAKKKKKQNKKKQNINNVVLANENAEANIQNFQMENIIMNSQNISNVSDSASDPFDPESLRINPENSGVSVRKVITSIPCKKPGKQDFVRVRPGEEWRLDTLILEDQETHDYYVASPKLHEYLMQDAFFARLTLAVTRRGDLFLWLQKLPRDGRSNRWNDSALVAVKEAETKWVRMAVVWS